MHPIPSCTIRISSPTGIVVLSHVGRTSAPSSYHHFVAVPASSSSNYPCSTSFCFFSFLLCFLLASTQLSEHHGASSSTLNRRSCSSNYSLSSKLVMKLVRSHSGPRKRLFGRSWWGQHGVCPPWCWCAFSWVYKASLNQRGWNIWSRTQRRRVSSFCHPVCSIACFNPVQWTGSNQWHLHRAPATMRDALSTGQSLIPASREASRPLLPPNQVIKGWTEAMQLMP